MNISLGYIGIFVIFLGILILILSGIRSENVKTEAAFVGFIGPIPIGIGTSKNILYLTVGLSLALLVIYLLFLKHLL